MRIELNSGGLDGVFAIAAYQNNMKGYISSAEKVADSFALVEKATWNLNGGVGNLQGALFAVATRQQMEMTRKDNAECIYRKTNSFLELAVRVDKQVAADVRRNQKEFYRVNPWLKPPVTNDIKGFLEQAWGWLCNTLVSPVREAFEFIADVSTTLLKIRDSIIEYCEQNFLKIASAILTGVNGFLTIVFVWTVMSAITLSGPLGIILAVIAGVAIGTTILTAGMDVINIFSDGALEDKDYYKITKTVNLVSLTLFTVISGTIGLSQTQSGSVAGNFLRTLKHESVDIAADVAEGWATWDNHNKAAQFVSFILSLAALGKGLYSANNSTKTVANTGADDVLPGSEASSKAGLGPELSSKTALGPENSSTSIPEDWFTPSVEPKGRGLAPDPISIEAVPYDTPSIKYDDIDIDLYPSIIPPSPAPYPKVSTDQALRLPDLKSSELTTVLDENDRNIIIQSNDFIISCLDFIDNKRKNTESGLN